MAFKRVGVEKASYDTPEALYRDLPRTPEAVPGLLTHQGDLLRQYAESRHVDARDIALELPTGTGKTIPALVICEWWRQTKKARAAYACPTDQLARQVAATANREGVPAVVLTGNHKSWPLDDRVRYDAGEAIAITTYSTVFNSSPKLEPHPDLLVFDDAHNGEQYVAEQYCVKVTRNGDEHSHPELFDKLLGVLAPGLSDLSLRRLRDGEVGGHDHVELVIPAQHDRMAEQIDAVLSSLDAPWTFRYSMIRKALASCLVYLNQSGIQIRPLIPQTEDNRAFTDARQRIYLSATLGDAGDLERSFGRSGILRIALPEPRSGQRFMVFPDLVSEDDAGTLTQEITRRAGKALVLAPDATTALATAAAIAQPGWPVLTKDNVKDGMDPLAVLPNGVCALASRYDGLDLPHDACRLVVIESVPDRDNLQERFLSREVRAGAALNERVRTRVVQGLGRCTRAANDWAIVVVRGQELTRYLLRPEILSSLSPDLQAEVRFGVENSRQTTTNDVLENVQAFLDQESSPTWREQAVPELNTLRASFRRKPPEGSEALAASVASEIEACALAGHNKWGEASSLANQVANLLSQGGEATVGYRAFWLLLAGMWAYRAAAEGDQSMLATAHRLVFNADRTARGAWVRSLPSLPDAPPTDMPPHDDIAVAEAARQILNQPPGKLGKRLTDMVRGLGEVSHTRYEPALTELGFFLGAEAAKPQGSGRSDSNWCWGNTMWFALEAKSEHTKPEGLVPHNDIRQVNDQLKLLAADRGHDGIPTGSITAIISPRLGVDPSGAIGAAEHSHLVHPDTMLELAREVDRAWTDLIGKRTGQDPAQFQRLVATAFTQHGILPSQVRDRLTEHPVSNLGTPA
ncbi:DEAD/DEAH box helicase family protein [Nocardia tengchongensis]|uniref:DEAD/DEAH box helicase family protein n=1 Tax=Nocardia tengchongensis TaxID=2055889 RepID=UPI00367CC402